MSKADKKIEKWQNNPPTDERIDAVEATLKRFLPGHYEKKPGSHIIVRHESLKNVEDFGPLGELAIPVKGGQKVKGFYLRRLALAINLIKGLNDK